MGGEFRKENGIFSKEKQSGISKRFTRLFWIAHEVRTNPRQSLKGMLQNIGISRTQYYEDKAILEECGLKFKSHPKKGFVVESDELKIVRLTEQEETAMLFVLSDVRVLGEGVIASRALEAGRKLVGEFDKRTRIIARFDMASVDTNDSGTNPEILEAMLLAMAEGRIIEIVYERSMDWTVSKRIVYPRYLYSYDGFLYLYARTQDETPRQWKVFRMARVKKVSPTNVSLVEPPEDDGNFAEKYKNIFMGYIGLDLDLHPVRIRIKGVSRNFVKNERVHHTQKIEEDAQGNLILTLRIPEPIAAKYWAMKYGDDAEILEPECIKDT